MNQLAQFTISWKWFQNLSLFSDPACFYQVIQKYFRLTLTSFFGMGEEKKQEKSVPPMGEFDVLEISRQLLTSIRKNKAWLGSEM